MMTGQAWVNVLFKPKTIKAFRQIMGKRAIDIVHMYDFIDKIHTCPTEKV